MVTVDEKLREFAQRLEQASSAEEVRRWLSELEAELAGLAQRERAMALRLERLEVERERGRMGREEALEAKSRLLEQAERAARAHGFLAQRWVMARERYRRLSGREYAVSRAEDFFRLIEAAAAGGEGA